MDYPSSLAYLYDLQLFGMKLGLENTRNLLQRLGNPQHGLRIVHIAGTNGKGSTAAALEQLLRSLGMSTGLYTSPHLHSFTERIRIDNQPLSEAEVAALIAEVRGAAKGLHPTFFEFTTVMALCAFARHQVDWVVLETGLGGRLDATNVVDPQLCILTTIAQDHAAYLGEDLAQIAAEKAGIIKSHVPLVSAAQAPEVLNVIARLAQQKAAPLSLAGKDFHWSSASDRFNYCGQKTKLYALEAGLCGRYQRENISLALAAVELLLPQSLQPVAVEQALKSLRWPGRLEWCGDLLLDGAHNPQAAAALANYLAEEGCTELIWIVAIKADKDAAGILGPLLPRVSNLLAVPLRDEQALSPDELVRMALAAGVEAEACSCAESALSKALELKSPEQKILVAGSLFLVAELRQTCLEQAGVVA